MQLGDLQVGVDYGLVGVNDCPLAGGKLPLVIFSHRPSSQRSTFVAECILQPTGYAQAKPGIERLYILNCGEGVAGDISRWSPGVNVGKSMDFVDNCYLIKHAQGWLLWDTGVTDAIAAMPDGQRPPILSATHWRRPKTLVSPARSARGQARRHQIRRGLAHAP